MTSKLQQRREGFDLTVSELAELANISTAPIYRIERNDKCSKISTEAAKALADALYCEVEDLFRDNQVSWNVGRPIRTGTPIAIVAHPGSGPIECPDCHMLVPPDIGCDYCGTPALIVA